MTFLVDNHMSVCVIGMGFVGLSMSCVIADKGFKVIGVDSDKQKISMISETKSPFFEPKVSDILKKNLGKNLEITENLKQAIEKSKIIFICVGTPSNPNGSSNLSYLENASIEIGSALKYITDGVFRTIIVKSTIPPQTVEKIVRPSLERSSLKKAGTDFGLSMNPEFLKEGSAVDDMLNPHLVVIGADDDKSKDAVYDFYNKLYSGLAKIMVTSIVNAELIKYANNAFLATKISFINTIANICNKIPGADVEVIASAIGTDPRIGNMFLKAGPGYGGSCFPKDVQGFLTFSHSIGYNPALLESTHLVNQTQPLMIVYMIEEKLKNLENKNVSILGLAFKKNTDDVREAVSIKIVKSLIEKKAKVKVHDPMAINNFKRIFQDSVTYCDTIQDCLKSSDCCVILTEWDEYKDLKSDDFKKYMKNPIVIDARRIYDVNNMTAIDYSAIGYGKVS